MVSRFYFRGLNFRWRLHDEKKKKTCALKLPPVERHCFQRPHVKSFHVSAFFGHVRFARTSPFVAASAFLKAFSAGGGELRTWGCGSRLLHGEQPGRVWEEARPRGRRGEDARSFVKRFRRALGRLLSTRPERVWMQRRRQACGFPHFQRQLKNDNPWLVESQLSEDNYLERLKNKKSTFNVKLVIN